MAKFKESMSIREFAVYMEVSDTTVHKWINKERIAPKNVDKSNPQRPKINVKEAEKDVEENRNAKHRAAYEAVNSPQPGRPKGSTNGAVSENKQKVISFIENGFDKIGPERVPWTKETMTGMHINDLLRIKESLGIELLEIKIAEESGKSVDKELVYHKLFAAGQLVRNEFLFFPGRVADDLVLAKDKHEIMVILEKAVNSALTQIAKINDDVKI